MFKLLKNKINVFLIIMAMFLLIVSSGNCEAKYQFDIAANNPIWGEGGILIQFFTSSVRHATVGEVDFNIFVGGEWSDSEEEIIQSVQFGTLDMAVVCTSPLSQYTDAIFMFDTPFLFKSTLDELVLTFDSTHSHTPIVTKKLEKASEESKFMILAVSPIGKRNVSSSKPIESVDDLKGLKIRVMNNPVQIDTYNYMGANAVPLPFSEIFTGLQLKSIDAIDGSSLDYLQQNFYEGAPHNYVIDHLASGMSIIVSMKAWDSLSTAYQNIVRECAISTAFNTSMWGTGSDIYLLESSIPRVAKSVTVTKITPEDKAELRKLVLPKLLDKYGEKIGIDVLEAISEGDEVITDWLAKK
jgi:TRAP-type C4-dicarboxylate transport system substrate-binding protein